MNVVQVLSNLNNILLGEANQLQHTNPPVADSLRRLGYDLSSIAGNIHTEETTQVFDGNSIEARTINAWERINGKSVTDFAFKRICPDDTQVWNSLTRNYILRQDLIEHICALNWHMLVNDLKEINSTIDIDDPNYSEINVTYKRNASPIMILTDVKGLFEVTSNCGIYNVNGCLGNTTVNSKLLGRIFPYHKCFFNDDTYLEKVIKPLISLKEIEVIPYKEERYHRSLNDVLGDYVEQIFQLVNEKLIENTEVLWHIPEYHYGVFGFESQITIPLNDRDHLVYTIVLMTKHLSLNRPICNMLGEGNPFTINVNDYNEQNTYGLINLRNREYVVYPQLANLIYPAIEAMIPEYIDFLMNGPSEAG